MRVVQLLTQAHGGPADHAVDVASALAARGFDSHVVGPLPSTGRPRHAAEVHWHDLAVRSKTDLAGAAAVSRRLHALRPHVLHVHDRRAGWLGRLQGRSMPATAVVHTLHGVPDGLADLVAGNVRAAPRRRRDPWLYLTGERWATRLGGSRVVVPTRAVARFAVDHVGLPARLVDVVPHGVDPERWRPSEPSRSSGPTSASGPVRALVLGGLDPVKRVPAVLEAVASTPGVGLTVAGSGPERAVVEARAARPDLAGRVEVLGAVADPLPLLRDADLLVVGSAAENCPLAVLQALATGTPVLSTAVGGVPEVVRDGVEGLLVPAHRPEALGPALARLAGDPALRTRLGRAARRRVLEAHTLDHCVDGLLRSYAAACRAHPGAVAS